VVASEVTAGVVNSDDTTEEAGVDSTRLVMIGTTGVVLSDVTTTLLGKVDSEVAIEVTEVDSTVLLITTAGVVSTGDV